MREGASGPSTLHRGDAARAETEFLTLRDGKRVRLAHWPAASDGQRGTVLLLSGRSESIEKY
ncbi:MAG TPA: hypothetical protein VFO41_11925, partial [Alphaproteobacteria bacterium]|nr:hypothetical protein [Alphaproteobacteria bacterium]